MDIEEEEIEMTDIRRVGDSGVHTAEGTVAGSRALQLSNEREKQRLKYEQSKQWIKEQNAVTIGRIDDKFTTGSDAVDAEFRRRTVGFQSAEDFKRVRENLRSIQAAEELTANDERKRLSEFKDKSRQEKRLKMVSKLSFSHDDDEEEVDDESDEQQRAGSVQRKLMKNPNVDTSFLPDRERDLMIEAEREKLRQEWFQEQERIKQEILEVQYSYWDGNGHRRSIRVSKGTQIGKFLEIVKSELVKEFPELKTTSVDGLMYIKEDLIIPSVMNPFLSPSSMKLVIEYIVL